MKNKLAWDEHEWVRAVHARFQPLIRERYGQLHFNSDRSKHVRRVLASRDDLTIEEYLSIMEDRSWIINMEISSKINPGVRGVIEYLKNDMLSLKKMLKKNDHSTASRIISALTNHDPVFNAPLRPQDRARLACDKDMRVRLAVLGINTILDDDPDESIPDGFVKHRAFFTWRCTHACRHAGCAYDETCHDC